MELPPTAHFVASGSKPALVSQLTTQPVDKLFKEEAPEGSYTETLQDVYYSPQSDSRRLTQVTVENQATYHEVAARAVEQGVLSADEAAVREKAFDTGAIGPYKPKAPSGIASPLLVQLRELEDEQFCLIRHPQQVGDGLYRPMDFYVSPGHLKLKGVAQGWPLSRGGDGQDLPVADVVVVGAGPGGLLASWQLARRGGRVVCFDSELAGSNYNDGGAKAVHHMRTSVAATNLVNEGNSIANKEHPLSLLGQIAAEREHARLGREGQTALTGEEMHGVPKDSQTLDPASPATRGELWDHLSNISYSLANDFPDAVLCERSPVSSVRFEDGLFTIQTSRGHEVKCRELVWATGLTGPQGEQARVLKVLDDAAAANPLKNVVVSKISDTQTEASRLEGIAQGTDASTLIMNDRLLGDQSLRQTLSALPDGSSVAMIGSGESAIKGALELAHLNPGLKVDLYVKDRLESNQTQAPAEVFHPAVVERTYDDPERSKKLKQATKFFASPVTPRSLQEVFELQAAGRLRLLEMGRRFDDKSVKLDENSGGGMTVTITDPNVIANLAEGESKFKSSGLLPKDAKLTSPTTYRALVVGIGYQALSVNDHPLLKELPTEARAKIHVNTISDASNPGQTGLPGLGAGGRFLAEELAGRLVPDDRRVAIPVPKDGKTYANVDLKTVDAIMANGGLDPEFEARIKKEIAEKGSSPDENWLTFTSGDSTFRDLAALKPEELSPAQREVLARGTENALRMKAWREAEHSR